jgi:hypothetical protein
MTYTLIIIVFMTAHDGTRGTAPLIVGRYPTADACNSVAIDVSKQQIMDHYERNILFSRPDDLRPICVPTPQSAP